MITLEDVAVTLGSQQVLDGTSLAVERGEFVGLVGPNGAGKSTLLHTVNGRLTPAAGTVTLGGDPVASLGAKETSRRVATVPQDTHVGFAFPVEAIVEMGRTPHRSRLDWGDDVNAVETAMVRTETTHLRDRPMDEVSGGERQRVLLARALAQETPALLLDEPTANLDINHQIAVLELVEDLVADGRAALAAIHDLDLAARFCDRLALLHDGAIAAVGDPETVLRSAPLTDAFETDVAVTTDDVAGAPAVTAVGDRPDPSHSVHVVGGGPVAAKVVGTCFRDGLDVTLGPVTEGDTGAALAADLGLEAVTVPPHREPTPPAVDRAAELVRAAALVVVADGRSAAGLDEPLQRHDTVLRLAPPGDDPTPRTDDRIDDTVAGPDGVLEAVGSAGETPPETADD